VPLKVTISDYKEEEFKKNESYTINAECESFDVKLISEENIVLVKNLFD
jgi:hypothetical protein